MMNTVLEYLELSEEVKKALDQNEAVVALESTIISHGMPYPQNMETARMLEDTVSQQGAVPATIAIIDGKLKVGLSTEEIHHLATSNQVLKASRRDLPYLVSQKKDGATTVAATMIIAAMAGIRVFATGGLGGVHRGVAETLDISADLTECAKTNVAVVCAGVKSILDIGLTLEYLETQGVPVIAYKAEEFPAFYTRSSGFKADYAMYTPEEIASMLKVKWEMGLTGGVIIGNPVPEEAAMEKAMIDVAIDKALAEASKREIRGKKITPFLLDRLKEITEGKSLETNIALVKNNARLAAEIAVNLARR
ncbi:pseudouridine-5'-phosphate glycosidase [Algivirga pacifica]|uniref:Pseudouridine-5'-phosphate glycosidase n=1 Tax=Algivirga pacifica TaxID=1162670 RepID=A0ABP9DL05_9BACT